MDALVQSSATVRDQDGLPQWRVATVRELISQTTTTLSADATAVTGNSLTVGFPNSLAPSLDLAPSNYTWTLWPHSSAGYDNRISDVALNDLDVRVAVASVQKAHSFQEAAHRAGI